MNFQPFSGCSRGAACPETVTMMVSYRVDPLGLAMDIVRPEALASRSGRARGTSCLSTHCGGRVDCTGIKVAEPLADESPQAGAEVFLVWPIAVESAV